MFPPEVLARFEAAWPFESLPERRARVVGEHGPRIALIDGDTRLTFAEADGLIARASARVPSGDTVAWCLPNGWRAAIVHHAILAAGAVPAPLPVRWTPAEVAAALSRLGAGTVITERTDLGGVALTPETLLDRGTEPHPARPLEPAARALVLFTSGTTSAPKGVLHSHRGLLTEVDSFVTMHELTPEDRYLCGPPVSHIAGLAYGILAPFALGTSTVFVPRWDPAEAVALLARERVTFMTGPPTFLLSMADHASGAGASSFRLFSTGGATIHEPAIRRAAEALGCMVKRAYGSTEVPTLTAGRLTDDEIRRLTTDGTVVGAAEMRIADGEIWARAPEMFTGYLGEADPFEAGGWFRTGDLGEVDVTGSLRVTGRLSDIIIRGGENIAAAEIEEALTAHPAVARAAVIGLPDERLGERACACVVVHDGARFDFDAMVEHLRARGLATYKLPERLEIVAELPVNDNGKVRKDELRARFGAAGS